MLRAAPYVIAVALGIAGCWAGARGNIVAFTQIAAAIGALSGLVAGLAQKIETKLSDLEKLDGLEKRVLMRLDARISARRFRLAVKRATIYVCSVLATASGSMVKAASADIAVWLYFVAIPATAVAVVGTTVLFFESASLDSALARLRRYVDDAKRANQEVERLKAAAKAEASKEAEKERRSSNRRRVTPA